jgi:hypothetical protein
MTLPDLPIRPLIQIDDLVREMTEEEHAQHLATMGTSNEYPELSTELEAEDETSTPS